MVFEQNSFFRVLLVVVLVMVNKMSAQEHQTGTFGMGIGGIISIGLQNETGLDIRAYYATTTEKNKFQIGYHRFFRREFENTQVFNEFEFGYQRKIYTWEPLQFYAGLSYLVNNYPISEVARNTSSLFVTTRELNHGLGLKVTVNFQLSKKNYIYAELTGKSFGRRYDTFGGGISYQLGR